MGIYKEAPVEHKDGWVVETMLNMETGDVAWTSATKDVEEDIVAMMPELRSKGKPFSKIVSFFKENFFFEMPENIG